uniref:Glutathione S-transferase T3-like n=1 Tax=Tanacetum cinerariifolium TaxID=118510 RepID=A0A6L2M030_TANCI|nr:hypothetical protein [Tanacetum cinerariifolium]
MLTEKWTAMNASVQKFNQLVSKTLAHSEENDEDWMTRVEILYKTQTNGEFKHKSAWKFLKDKHKWKNPDSTLARRNRLRVTDDEPEHFGDDVFPRPPRWCATLEVQGCLHCECDVRDADVDWRRKRKRDLECEGKGERAPKEHSKGRMDVIG